MAAAGAPALSVTVSGFRDALLPGDQLSFGRSDPEQSRPAHLALSDNPRLHLLAGRIEVDEDGWVLTNTGRWLHLRVIELDGPNRLDLQPGRTIRIPYARCRIELTTGDATIAFEVACPWLAARADDPAASYVPLSGSTVGALELDRDAGYFRALVALCAPRLRDLQSREVSTTADIARMLNAFASEPQRVTVKAVERRLANVRRKLGLAATDAYGGSAAGLEQRDASRQLADLVLRTGTVTPADLALVEPGAVRGEPAEP